MARRKSKARTTIENYVQGKNLKPFALGTGLVFISPITLLRGHKAEGYYLHVKVTPPKGKPFWVGTCKGIRFSENDRCKHTDEFDRQIEATMDKIIAVQDKPKKEISKAIRSGRQERKQQPKEYIQTGRKTRTKKG